MGLFMPATIDATMHTIMSCGPAGLYRGTRFHEHDALLCFDISHCRPRPALVGVLAARTGGTGPRVVRFCEKHTHTHTLAHYRYLQVCHLERIAVADGFQPYAVYAVLDNGLQGRAGP